MKAEMETRAGPTSGHVPIYVVSLERDVERRAYMRQRFGAVWQTFEIVQAVDARMLPNELPKACRHNRRKPLGDAEKACALSHMEVWRRFLASGEATCIVFEDDVIGDASGVERAIRLMRATPDGVFTLLGGQEGLRNRRHVFGVRQYLADVWVWRLYRPDRRFLARACCYGLTRAVAGKLLEKQQRCLDRADQWLRLLGGIDDVHYVPLFAHPMDLSGSHLEDERASVAAGRATWRRVWADGIVYTCQSALIRMVWPWAARLLQLERVWKEGE